LIDILKFKELIVISQEKLSFQCLSNSRMKYISTCATCCSPYKTNLGK